MLKTLSKHVNHLRALGMVAIKESKNRHNEEWKNKFLD